MTLAEGVQPEQPKERTVQDILFGLLTARDNQGTVENSSSSGKVVQQNKFIDLLKLWLVWEGK